MATIPNVHPKRRDSIRPIHSQDCTCGRRGEVVITYSDGGQRIFCGPHAVYQLQMPGVSFEYIVR